mmetsp:Transcript_18802/g.28155  ORF Transcript_18802/g.28155 Transcript_18802/m.28155 type:complete len:399 (+) Transcript_18802:42-1238(+)
MQNESSSFPYNHNILLNQDGPENDGNGEELGVGEGGEGGIEMATLETLVTDPHPDPLLQGGGIHCSNSNNHSDCLEFERSNWNGKSSTLNTILTNTSNLASSVTAKATRLLGRKKLLLILLLTFAGVLVVPFINNHTQSKNRNRNTNENGNVKGWEKHIIRMDQKREGHGAVPLNNNQILLTGGRNDGGFRVLNSVEIIDINKNSKSATKTTIPKMKSARCDHASAQINGYAYVIGGHNGHDFLKSVERLRIHSKMISFSLPMSNKKIERWENIDELNKERSGCAAAVHKDDIFVFGGEDKNGNTLSTVEYLHTTRTSTSDSGGWTVIEEQMKMPRFKHAAVTVGNRIYIIGGRDNHRHTIDSVEIFNTGQIISRWINITNSNFTQESCCSHGEIYRH